MAVDSSEQLAVPNPTISPEIETARHRSLLFSLRIAMIDEGSPQVGSLTTPEIDTARALSSELQDRATSDLQLLPAEVSTVCRILTRAEQALYRQNHEQLQPNDLAGVGWLCLQDVAKVKYGRITKGLKNIAYYAVRHSPGYLEKLVRTYGVEITSHALGENLCNPAKVASEFIAWRDEVIAANPAGTVTTSALSDLRWHSSKTYKADLNRYLGMMQAARQKLRPLINARLEAKLDTQLRPACLKETIQPEEDFDSRLEAIATRLQYASSTIGDSQLTISLAFRAHEPIETLISRYLAYKEYLGADNPNALRHAMSIEDPAAARLYLDTRRVAKELANAGGHHRSRSSDKPILKPLDTDPGRALDDLHRALTRKVLNSRGVIRGADSELLLTIRTGLAGHLGTDESSIDAAAKKLTRILSQYIRRQRNRTRAERNPANLDPEWVAELARHYAARLARIPPPPSDKTRKAITKSMQAETIASSSDTKLNSGATQIKKALAALALSKRSLAEGLAHVEAHPSPDVSQLRRLKRLNRQLGGFLEVLGSVTRDMTGG